MNPIHFQAVLHPIGFAPTQLILLLALCCTLTLTACGGAGGAYVPARPATPSDAALPPSADLANQCTPSQEKAYLRSFVDETYLWYRDVPTNLVPANYATPQDYFDVLKTNAITASGTPVDQFHWSQTTASWDAAQAGLSQDYGIQWAAQSTYPPRKFIVSEVMPGSPAAAAGIQRGDEITSVDGVDFVNDNTQLGVSILIEGLFPTVVATHQLGFNGGAAISLQPANFETITVQNVKTFATSNGTVGYFLFDSHIAKSEAELTSAINQLKAAQVTDLVLDMRYNGGGLLYIASELAYMIAGPANTSDKTFEKISYNDKLSASSDTVFPFASTGTDGQELPYLGLRHVTLLVTRGTASASESVINSLRGVDVTVDLIGSTTRGKPYGFVPQPNCGYTYFAIQFKGVNAKGFGDYADGFSPTCVATDDLNHALGDANEGMLKAALSYRLTGQCPPSASAQLVRASPALGQLHVLPPAAREWRILNGIRR